MTPIAPSRGAFAFMMDEQRELAKSCDEAEKSQQDIVETMGLTIRVLGASPVQCHAGQASAQRPVDACLDELKAVVRKARNLRPSGLAQDVLKRLPDDGAVTREAVAALAHDFDRLAQPLVRLGIQMADDGQRSLDQIVNSLSVPVASALLRPLVDVVAAEAFASALEEDMAQPQVRLASQAAVRRVACQTYFADVPRSKIAIRLLKRLIRGGDGGPYWLPSYCREVFGENKCSEIMAAASPKTSKDVSELAHPGAAAARLASTERDDVQARAEAIKRAEKALCGSSGSACDFGKIADAAGAQLLLDSTGGTSVAAIYHRYSVELRRSMQGGCPATPSPSSSSTPPPIHSCPPGAHFEPGKGCISEVIRLDAGKFMMGANDGNQNERPAHEVKVSAFELDVHEVTVSQYAECVRGKACADPPTTVTWTDIAPDVRQLWSAFCNGERADRRDHPINCIDWNMANAYCAWAGKRLPTEEEWEYAARGTEGRIYPWGAAKPSSALLNACGAECVRLGQQAGQQWAGLYTDNDGWQATAPVGSFQRGSTPTGLHDMAGNVWEWASSGYSDSYERSRVGEQKVVRGGSFRSGGATDVRSTNRHGRSPLDRDAIIGMRCAR